MVSRIVPVTGGGDGNSGGAGTAAPAAGGVAVGVGALGAPLPWPAAATSGAAAGAASGGGEGGADGAGGTAAGALLPFSPPVGDDAAPGEGGGGAGSDDGGAAVALRPSLSSVGDDAAPGGGGGGADGVGGGAAGALRPSLSSVGDDAASGGGGGGADGIGGAAAGALLPFSPSAGDDAASGGAGAGTDDDGANGAVGVLLPWPAAVDGVGAAADSGAGVDVDAGGSGPAAAEPHGPTAAAANGDGALTYDSPAFKPLADAVDRLNQLRQQHGDGDRREFPASAEEAATTRRNCDGRQKEICAILATYAAADLLATLGDDNEAVAVLISCAGDHAGAWLTASPALRDNYMPDSDFSIASALRLRLPIALPHLPKVAGVCVCCGKNQNLHGDHAFRCPHVAALRTARHTGLVDAFFLEVFGAGGTGISTLRARKSTKEGAKGLSVAAASFPLRPGVTGESLKADIVIEPLPGAAVPWTQLVDFVVKSVRPDLYPSHGDVNKPGASAAEGEADKIAKYTSRHQLEKKNVRPVAIETYGRMGKDGAKLIRELANAKHPVDEAVVPDGGGKTRLVDKDGRRALFIRGIRERIAVTLQCGNADAIRVWARGCFSAVTIAAGA